MTTIQKIFFTLVVFGSLLWLGVSVARMVAAFTLFEAGTLDFAEGISDEVRLSTMSVFATLSFYSISGYVMTLVSGIPLWLQLRNRWKTQGWIFAAGLLVLLFTPLEIWQMLSDIEIIRLFQGSLPRPAHAEQLFIERLQMGSGLPLIAMLSYFTALLFCIWQPLTRSNEVSQ